MHSRSRRAGFQGSRRHGTLAAGGPLRSGARVDGRTLFVAITFHGRLGTSLRRRWKRPARHETNRRAGVLVRGNGASRTDPDADRRSRTKSGSDAAPSLDVLRQLLFRLLDGRALPGRHRPGTARNRRENATAAYIYIQRVCLGYAFGLFREVVVL